MHISTCLAAICLFGSASYAVAATPYQTVVDDYFHGEWLASPTNATSNGLHDWDDKLDDVSAAAHARHAAALTRTVQALRAIDGASLMPMDRDDRDILAAQIDGQLLEELTVQQWRHNPGPYVDLATSGVYSLIERDFAPLPDRMRDVIAREQAIPGALADAKRNLSDIPPVYIDIALENLDGGLSFIGKDAPGAFSGVHDAALQASLAASTKAALYAMNDYRAFLVAQKPNAHGDFVIGRDALQRLLAVDLVTVPVEQVLSVGRARLAEDRAAFLETEKRVDPADPSGALESIEHDHPDAAHLISTARDGLVDLQRFIRARHIVTLPSDQLPVVGETPPFARAVVFGEMDPPGNLETHAIKAYYFITPPDASQTPAEQENLLEYFNRALLQNLSVHEALPGHFTQYLFARANPDWSIVRKTAHSYTATEGWAHYSEQMMLDEGLGGDAPRLRLAQLQDALLRDCRLVASLAMHTRQDDARRSDQDDEGPVLSARQRGVQGSPARDVGPRLFLLHSGQAPDHQAARGCPGQGRRELHPGAVPRPFPQGGPRADRDHPP